MQEIIRRLCIKIIENRTEKIRNTLDEHEKIKAKYIKDRNYKKLMTIEEQIKLDKEILRFMSDLHIAFLY